MDTTNPRMLTAESEEFRKAKAAFSGRIGRKSWCRASCPEAEMKNASLSLKAPGDTNASKSRYAREKKSERKGSTREKRSARGSGHHEGKVAERHTRERRKDDVSALDSAQREPRACWAAPRGLRGGGVAGRAKAGRLTFFSFVIREQRGKNGWAAARLLSHADAPLLGYDDDDRPLLLLRAHPSQPGKGAFVLGGRHPATITTQRGAGSSSLHLYRKGHGGLNKENYPQMRREHVYAPEEV
ncbi:hypothetical protein HPB51_009265 [Rhipicephalus microplus]|uniref:Uncharacterized protein n=1 Tax=Rhipicephalus microplus TaxID=6941 RepID=A0A9J6F0J2_RHIMP|nr:hypothetical protein HPB51_009265 [Rhipicephalus microplus]